MPEVSDYFIFLAWVSALPNSALDIVLFCVGVPSNTLLTFSNFQASPEVYVLISKVYSIAQKGRYIPFGSHRLTICASISGPVTSPTLPGSTCVRALFLPFTAASFLNIYGSQDMLYG
jgi:hypothetical protein